LGLAVRGSRDVRQGGSEGRPFGKPDRIGRDTHLALAGPGPGAGRHATGSRRQNAAGNLCPRFHSGARRQGMTIAYVRARGATRARNVNAKPERGSLNTSSHYQRPPMIETRDLTKMYGELYALNRLTLKLERGDVYGFIGPNGAGKTTTMRI